MTERSLWLSLRVSPRLLAGVWMTGLTVVGIAALYVVGQASGAAFA